MHRIYRRAWAQFGVLPFTATVLLLFLVTVSLGNSDRAAPSWQAADQVAPPELLEQVRQENFNLQAQVEIEQMKVWKIEQPSQSWPLYLIDTRTSHEAETPAANPLCGARGCVFLAYIAVDGVYQRVFHTYLDPRLPPGLSLFHPASELRSGLPCLVIPQLENRKIRAFHFCFNGQSYELLETQLLPQVYE
jgi:hypothetical protein